jgi:hypothetical protein
MNEHTNGKPEQETVVIDETKHQMLMQELRDNQNLLFGIIGGIAAAAVGATIWAVVTYLTNYQIGWMAVGVGFLVGIAVRIFGKGIDTIFGVVGAALSLIGCLSGNLLAVCIVVSQQENIPFFDLLTRLNLEIIAKVMKDTFSVIDLLFYGIAVYEGYRFSFRKISEEELAELVR